MIVIPSGRPKIWDTQPEKGLVPAKKAYTGTFHRLCREYAASLNQPYVILSPYYGFLSPNTLVPHTYDVQFTQKGTTPETIQLDELQKQWRELDKPDGAITVLGGKKFEPLMKSIAGPDQGIHFPLIGLGGIGHMQAALKHAIETQTALP